jgi:hypothetical protein
MPFFATIQTKPTRTIVVFFVSVGLSLFLSSAFAFFAYRGGFLFGGAPAIVTVLVAAGVSTGVSLATALLFKSKRKNFGWGALLAHDFVLALVAVGILSWRDTRQQMWTLTGPSHVTIGLDVHHGYRMPFSSDIHFTGEPSAIATLLKSKGLVEVPAELQDASDPSPFLQRERSKKLWDWWRPTMMPNPRFFYLHHDSMAVQGWSEGWWVSGATNEVFAFIRG